MKHNILNPATFDEIAAACGRQATACSCERCKNQCRTPCLGTPDDIVKLLEAGYGDRLTLSTWVVGMMMGVTKEPIQLVIPKVENGWCTFRRPDGLCELHDKGLKPTEGRLSHHVLNAKDFNPQTNLTWLVAKSWRGLGSLIALALAAEEAKDGQQESETKVG